MADALERPSAGRRISAGDASSNGASWSMACSRARRSRSGWSPGPTTASRSARSTPAPPTRRRSPAAAPGTPWAIMQRVDHPDPAAANARGAARPRERRDRPGAGVRRLGRRLWLRPRRLGRRRSRACSTASISTPASRSTSISPRRPRTPASADRRAGRSGAASTRRRPTSASASIRSAPRRSRAAARCPGPSWRRDLPRPIADLAAQGFRGPFAVADGRVIHNAGGSEAQELAYVLAVAVAYLRALEAGGIALDAARGMIYFRLAADADQFLTIAKFRALRKLWARVEAGLRARAASPSSSPPKPRGG